MKRKTAQREYPGINPNYGFDFIILAELSRVVISKFELDYPEYAHQISHQIK